MTDQLKCVCRGFNPECNYCYGVGYVVEDKDAHNKPLGARPVTYDRDKAPNRQKSQTRVFTKPGKLTLEEAIIRHGRVGDDTRQPKRLIRLLNILDARLKGGDEETARTYPSLRLKLQKALRIERNMFLRFMKALLDSAVSGKRSSNGNVNLALSSSDVRFMAEDIDLLHSAFVSTLPKKVLEERERSEFLEFKAKPAENKRPEPELKRSVPTAPTSLLVFAPQTGLKPDDLEKIRRHSRQSIQQVYLAGSKRSLRDFSAAFPSASVTLVENPANADMLSQSSVVSTLDLRAADKASIPI